jgi:hypothetical protein
MKSRIAMWAAMGFLIAFFWELFVLLSVPFANQRMEDVWLLAAITCPVTLVRHLPITWYAVLIANTATYALLGLTVETLRKKTPLTAPR